MTGSRTLAVKLRLKVYGFGVQGLSGPVSRVFRVWGVGFQGSGVGGFRVKRQGI